MQRRERDAPLHIRDGEKGTEGKEKEKVQYVHLFQRNEITRLVRRLKVKLKWLVIKTICYPLSITRNHGMENR